MFKKKVMFKKKDTLFIMIVLFLSVFFYMSHGLAQAIKTPTDIKTINQNYINKPFFYLYFINSKGKFLHAVERPLTSSMPSVAFGNYIIKTLIDGPEKNDLIRTIPEGTKLRALYITEKGAAYVDFNREITDNHPGGIETETLTIYSIVNSLILNVPQIKTVKILINGNESTTLAGHIDLRFPLTANMMIVR